ncbi:MAG: hypothetical protein RL477_1028 [Pseudomonadota bacterium]
MLGNRYLSEPVNPKERRLVLRLLGHWRDLCGDRDWPGLSDVASAGMGDMWDFSFVIELNGGKPKFRHFGAWHAEFYGTDMSGHDLDALTRDTLAERSTRYLPEVLRRRIPITYGGEVTEPSGRKILYRSILLPLSDNGETLTGILGGANCKLAADQDGA